MAKLTGILQMLSEDRHAEILDFGCGDGREMKIMLENGYVNVTGFDIVRNSKKHLEGNVVIEPDSIGFLEQNKCSFDVIFSREAVYYTPIELQERLWKAFYGSLKPGGRLVVITFNGALSTSTWILQKDLAMKFAFNELTLRSFPQDAGFVDISIESMTPEHGSFLGAFLFSFVLAYGQIKNRLRYFSERGLDSQNPKLFSKQLVMTACKTGRENLS